VKEEGRFPLLEPRVTHPPPPALSIHAPFPFLGALARRNNPFPAAAAILCVRVLLSPGSSLAGARASASERRPSALPPKSGRRRRGGGSWRARSRAR